MAFDEIKRVRLGVCDPVGYNDFVQVGDRHDLPRDNVPPQTAYSLVAEKVYKAFCAERGEWQIVATELSDERIRFFVSEYGEDKARWHCLKAILVSLGRKIGLARMKSGADDLTFLALQDLHAFYKGLLEDIKDAIDPPNKAGFWLATEAPVVAGGI